MRCTIVWAGPLARGSTVRNTSPSCAHKQWRRIFSGPNPRSDTLRFTATRCGTNLLPDPYVLSLPGWQFVLSHGDALCTDDKDYQAFRAQVRTPQWHLAFLRKPLNERKAIAAAMRQQSENSKREKLKQAQSMMDLNPSDTDDFLRAHGYATFIHGHTHRPATHNHLVDGIHVERWVLSDWHEDQGECLCWNGEQLTREAL